MVATQTALSILVAGPASDKGWPAPVKRLVRTVYIDPFFNRQLKREMFSWL